VAVGLGLKAGIGCGLAEVAAAVVAAVYSSSSSSSSSSDSSSRISISWQQKKQHQYVPVVAAARSTHWWQGHLEGMFFVHGLNLADHASYSFCNLAMLGLAKPPWPHCTIRRSPTRYWPFGCLVHENVEESHAFVFGGNDREHGLRAEGRQERTAARCMHLIDVIVDDTGFLEDGLSPKIYHGHDVHSSTEMSNYELEQTTKSYKWNKVGAMASIPDLFGRGSVRVYMGIIKHSFSVIPSQSFLLYDSPSTTHPP
jgi:hypothetical protein